MAIIKTTPDTQPIANATVFEYIDSNTGAVRMREIVAHEGYALYDKTEVTSINPDTGLPFPPTYSYTASLPISVPVTNFETKLIDETMDVNGDTPEQPETEVM